MKTVGDKIQSFALTGVKPGQPEDAFFTIDDDTFMNTFSELPRTLHIFHFE